MVKIGDTLFVSSVEIKVPTKRFPQPVDGYDRDTGEGVGHLFKIDLKGNLVGELKLGEGSIYHPGGIDYDGKDIWVPVAEYRPNSRAIIYRVDPETMKATEVFRFADHIGGVVHNTDDNTLHGVSWGSRRFYRWPLGRDGKRDQCRRHAGEAAHAQPLALPRLPGLQICSAATAMLCTGVTEMRLTPEAPPFRLGGVDLVDLPTAVRCSRRRCCYGRRRGMDMTHNPVWIEPSEAGLRGYFMPEDDKSTLYIYDVGAK